MFQRLPVFLLAALVIVLPVRGQSTSQSTTSPSTSEPPNLDLAKKELTRYIESGTYGAKVAEVAVKASKYVTKRAAKIKPGQKLAIVFDIDETTLSNMSVIQANGFGYNPKLWTEWISEGRAPAILPVQALYETAVRHGLSVFFITSRLEATRAATERNLRTVGYDAWANVFLRTKEDLRTTKQYKTGARREIEAAGYIIVANVGDQDSDLDGGHAERTFKLPNPFYIVY